MRFSFKLFAAFLAMAAVTANAKVVEEETFSFEVDSDASFSIDNVNGDIEITGVGGNTIDVIAIKSADSQKALDRIEILVEADSKSVDFETKHNKGGSGIFNWGDSDGGSVSYQVHLPSTVRLDTIDSVNGSIIVSGVSADVSIDTVNGSIEVSGLTGDASLDTVNGRITARFDRFEGHQRAKCDTVNGAIYVYLPGDTSASVTAESLNGSINGGDFDLEEIEGRFVGHDMNGDIGGGSARLSLDTVNGAIRVARN